MRSEGFTTEPTSLYQVTGITTFLGVRILNPFR